MSFPCFRVAAMAIAGGVSLSAQTDWSRITQLPAGAKIRVVQTDGMAYKSLVAAATDQAIRLQSGIDIPRTSVRRIEDRSRNKRLRNALIGAAIGAGVGAILDATVGTYARNESRPEVRTGLYVYSIGIGAGLGALVPSHPAIYKNK